MPFYDQPSRRTPHDVRRPIRFAFWAIWAALFLALPTRLYNGEVLRLSERLDTTPWWETFHPNAFAWAPLLAWGMHVARALGFTEELQFLQWANSLIALLILATVYRWSRVMGARTSVAFTITGFVGANFTFWHWGTDVNPYLLMTLFGTWAVWCAWSYATAWHKDRLYWSAIFLGLAMWIHLLAIVLVIPIWYAIWSRQEHATDRKWLAWGAHFTISGLMVLLPYLYVSEVLYRDEPTGGLVPFVSQIFQNEDRLPPKAYREAPIRRLVRGAALGHFNLAWWCDADEVYYTYRPAEDEPQLFDSVLLGQVVPYVWLLNTMLAVIALFPTVNMLRTGESGRTLMMFLLWTTPSFFIIGAIHPAYGYLRLIYLPAMALLIGLWISLSPQTRKRPIQALVILMLLWNFAMGIWPNSAWVLR